MITDASHFRQVIENQDAAELAAIMELPPSRKTSGDAVAHPPKSLYIGELDFGLLWHALLDARSAAEVVRSETFKSRVCIDLT